MNNLRSALEKLKFDIRMIDIHMKNNNLTDADFEKHLKSLQDAAENSKKLSFNHDGSAGEEE